MNWDECEYIFELAELEPLADAPLADLFLDWGSHSGGHEARRQSSQSTGNTPTESKQATSSSVAAPPPTGHLPATPPDNSASPPIQGHSQFAGNGHSEFAIDSREDNQATPPKTSLKTRDESPAEFANTSGTSQVGRTSGQAVSPKQREQQGSVHWQERMSVHVLGQFVFCSRAGIYAAENGEEADPDEAPLNWSFLPNYDLERIEEKIQECLRQWLLVSLLAMVFLAGTAAGMYVGERSIFYPAVIGALFALNAWLSVSGDILTLTWRRAAARRAQSSEPDTDVNRIQSANWWSLLKAGFEPVEYQRQFRHPELPLEGSPWRVLERDSLRIPVIKSGARKLGDAKHTIYLKHELRLAAYAVLLEATEHVQVPYALVFPADSHLGLAVPITPSLREQVAEQLQRANDLQLRSQRGESEPRPPQNRQRCAACRLGEPIPISDAEIKSAKRAHTQLLVLADRMDRKYHCACGDRFGSAPPHRRIVQLELRSSVD